MTARAICRMYPNFPTMTRDSLDIANGSNSASCAGGRRQHGLTRGSGNVGRKIGAFHRRRLRLSVKRKVLLSNIPLASSPLKVRTRDEWLNLPPVWQMEGPSTYPHGMVLTPILTPT